MVGKKILILILSDISSNEILRLWVVVIFLGFVVGKVY